jgi:hypothetical protein
MRWIVGTVLVAVLVAGCGSGDVGPRAVDTGQPVDAALQKSDAALILTMYADVNAAFARSPSAGVAALIATQYPGDLADVDPVRCMAALSTATAATPSPSTSRSRQPTKAARSAAPKASATAPTTSGPMHKRMTYTPRILTLAADPTFQLTSDRVRDLHPRGRVYVTDIVITDGGRPTIRTRHQVVLDGRAYQFTSC